MKTSLIFSLLLSVVQFLCTVQAAYKVSGFTFNSELTLPYGIWKDPNDGMLYISEPIKHKVWRVDSTDHISPFIGTGIAGFTGDGDLQSAQLSRPRGIWGDGRFLYICDSKNDRLRLVKLDENKISTIAGGGSALPTATGPPLLGTEAMLISTHAVWVDPNTKVIYISDESKVYTILTNGLINVFAGGGSDYSTRWGIAATAVQLTEPSFIIGDGKGNVYISDSGNNMIRKVTVNGMTSVVAGFARSSAIQLPDTPMPVGKVGLGTPKGLWLSSERVLLFVDTALFSVGIVNLEMGTFVRFAGSQRTGGDSRDDNGDKFGDGGDGLLAMFNNPVGICGNNKPLVSSSRFYITDTSHSAVRGLISTLTSAPSRRPTTIPSRGPTRTPTRSPTRTPTRTPTRSPTRRPTRSPTVPPAPGTIIGFPSNYWLFVPYAVWGDESGNLYVTDPSFNVVWKVLPNVATQVFSAVGTGRQAFNGDAPSLADRAYLNTPKGIYGEFNFLYIADSGNNRIRQVNLQTNIISTIAGGGTQSPSSQSQFATAVKLNGVTAVYVDSSTHNIYITSVEGVLRITPTRNIELVFPASVPTIEYLAGDNLGRLYFRYDQGSSAIFRYDFVGLPERIVGQSLPVGSGEPFEDGSNALSAHLGNPSGLWFDVQANRLFFADRQTQIVGVYDPVSKTVSRVGGQFQQCGGSGHDVGNEFGDNGPARDAFLCIPGSIWGNSKHNLFIMDDGHDGLREIIFTNR
jgi:hypothetical protein